MRILKAVIIVFIMLEYASSYADVGWKIVTKSKLSNSYFEVDKTSIEDITPSVVRAQTRFTRIDQGRSIRGLQSDVITNEMLIEFDCSKIKYRLTKVTHITASGEIRPVQLQQTPPPFEDIPEGTMFNIMREFVCRTAGKL